MDPVNNNGNPTTDATLSSSAGLPEAPEGRKGAEAGALSQEEKQAFDTALATANWSVVQHFALTKDLPSETTEAIYRTLVLDQSPLASNVLHKILLNDLGRQLTATPEEISGFESRLQSLLESATRLGNEAVVQLLTAKESALSLLFKGEKVASQSEDIEPQADASAQAIRGVDGGAINWAPLVDAPLTTSNGFIARCLKSDEELREAGRALNNCLGMEAYTSSATAGRSVFFTFTDPSGKVSAALELGRDSEGAIEVADGSRWAERVFAGSQNNPPSEEVWAAKRYLLSVLGSQRTSTSDVA